MRDWATDILWSVCTAIEEWVVAGVLIAALILLTAVSLEGMPAEQCGQALLRMMFFFACGFLMAR